jgi:8-oxo-dGTP pyrophosphatase MutT (NUDIX family)
LTDGPACGTDAIPKLPRWEFALNVQRLIADVPPVVERKTQFAALPWRVADGDRVEVLLMTSRETRRWVIAKGWSIRGLAPNMTASREAYEEAGVEGYVAMTPIGEYAYDKRKPSGRLQAVRVEVYALQVTVEHADWPEQFQRDKLWTSPQEAATLVHEPGLRDLLSDFRPLGQRVI